MKIAASEAQWNTCQPCGFSLFQIGGFTRRTTRPRAFSITIPRLLSYMATGSFNGQVQGLNQLQAQEQSKYGPGNYMPNVRLIYWSMRVMACSGVADVPDRRRRGVAVPQAEARDGALVPVDGDRGDRVPVHRRDRRLDPDRDGPPAVDRAGPAEDRPRRTRRASARPWSRSASASSSLLYVVLGVVDFVLMRRYARLDPAAAARGALPDAGGST